MICHFHKQWSVNKRKSAIRISLTNVFFQLLNYLYVFSTKISNDTLINSEDRTKEKFN